MSDKEMKKKWNEKDDVILLEDLQPRKDVKGKGRRLLFGQNTSESEGQPDSEEETGGHES